MSYDAIVIGAGINGLVAATVLARKDRKVALFDRRETVGGMATLAKDDGPALAHLLYNLSPTVLRDLGIDGAQWPFKVDPLPTVALCPSGEHVVIEGRTARFASGSAHPDAAAYARMIKQLTGYADLLRGLAEGPPPGGGLSTKALLRYGRFGIGVRRLGRREMRKFLQRLLSNAADLILDEMPDGPLAGSLAADAVRGGTVGPMQPGTVMSLVYRLGHGGGVARPTGGMQTVFDTLFRQAEKAGVEMHLGQSVDHIVIEDDAVRAVVTGDGTRWDTRRILSSIALPALLPLTGPAHFDIEATSRICSTRARGTCAKVNLRLKEPLKIPGLTRAQTDARLIYAPSVAYVDRAANPVKYRAMTKTPVIEAVPTGDWLSCIVQFAPSDLAGGWTDAVRATLVQQTIETLAKVAPNLNDQIAETQVMTAEQIEAETAAPGGHWHHAEMALDQLLSLRPGNGMAQYTLGPSGLYLCGASAHPGGDVMGLAGRNAALKTLEDMG